jgi:structure-specific endonuclease subunit SLX1
MFVYLLICSDDSTYVGATIDTNRRLRQHNSEIKGGAKRTTSKVAQGKTWKRVCYISGFPDWTACLQFEWRWKQLSRKYQNNKNPLQRRLTALNDLLSLDQSTSKAIPFSQWSSKPTVNVENDFVEICPLHLHEDIQLEMSP